MRTAMASIKKYIPVLLTLLLGVLVLASQVFFKSKNIIASPSKASNKIKLHYESSLKDILKDESLGLSSKEPPVIIVNFWASWCIPCLEEFPSLVQLRKEYGKDKLLIVGINSDEPSSYQDVKKVIKKYKLNFPIIYDQKKKASLVSKFKVSAIPISIVFNKGKVVEVSNGAKDFYSGEFLEKLNSYLKE